MLADIFKKFGIDVKLIKFGMVGIINTLFGTTLMFVLYNVFNCSYYVSSFSNYFFGSILSYILNKYFTFGYKKKDALTVLKFIVNIAICYCLAYLAIRPAVRRAASVFSERIQDNIAMVVGMCVFVLLNYYGQRFFVFKDSKK